MIDYDAIKKVALLFTLILPFVGLVTVSAGIHELSTYTHKGIILISLGAIMIVMSASLLFVGRK